MLIERGQADAIRLVRSTVNSTPGAATVNEPAEMNATGVSGVPQMVFVDDKGLEEQFLTEDEDTPNVLDTTVNHVTTPVDTIQGTQQAQEEELDLLFSKTEEEHLQHLEEIFVRLRKFGLKMKREKCSFFKKHIQYLGHLVSEKGFEPLPEKLESI